MALPGSQQPVSLGRARSRRQRLDRLAAVVERVVGVQAGLVEAVDRLERRTGPEDRRVQPEPAMAASPVATRRGPLRRGVRLAIQVLGVLVAGLAVAVVFSAGQSLHPSVGMPPALADPTTTTGRVKPAATGGQAGHVGGGVVAVASTGGQPPKVEAPRRPRPGGWGGVWSPTSTTAALMVPTTTVPTVPDPSVTIPEAPTSTTTLPPCEVGSPKKKCEDG